jgi:hypothetical protein
MYSGIVTHFAKKKLGKFGNKMHSYSFIPSMVEFLGCFPLRLTFFKCCWAMSFKQGLHIHLCIQHLTTIGEPNGEK